MWDLFIRIRTQSYEVFFVVVVVKTILNLRIHETCEFLHPLRLCQLLEDLAKGRLLLGEAVVWELHHSGMSLMQDRVCIEPMKFQLNTFENFRYRPSHPPPINSYLLWAVRECNFLSVASEFPNFGQPRQKDSSFLNSFWSETRNCCLIAAVWRSRRLEITSTSFSTFFTYLSIPFAFLSP
jgi:hypothetical protein